MTDELSNAITRLYAAVLVYLAAAKRYFQGSLVSRCHLVHHHAGYCTSLGKSKLHMLTGLIEKIGRGLLDTMMKRYEALQEDMSETDVGKLLRVADAECECITAMIVSSKICKADEVVLVVRQRIEANEASHRKDLQTRLERLDKPIMSMAVDISQIRDQFKSE